MPPITALPCSATPDNHPRGHKSQGHSTALQTVFLHSQFSTFRLGADSGFPWFP